MPNTTVAGTPSTVGDYATELPVASRGACMDVQGDSRSLVVRLRHCGVVIPQWNEVSDYLEQHQDLALLLPPICEQARKEFGPPSEITIQLYRDPEVADEYLTLCVRQPIYEVDMLDRIQRLWDVFGRQLDDASGYLLLTTDFRPSGVSDVL